MSYRTITDGLLFPCLMRPEGRLGGFPNVVKLAANA